ncbi:hypothetical protein HDV00_006964 [Rhizophlyctis rosea]|nr:hypothetical protein HDV00_006964 [Rhizophlyctis rosea]
MTQTQLFKLAKQMNNHNPAFVPIPASRENKSPLGKWAGSSYLFEKDFPKREQWEPNCNLGLLVSDQYIVIDVDAKPPATKGNKKVYSENKGTDDLATLMGQHEPLPPTLGVDTPSDGDHWYFWQTGRPGEELLKNWTSCMSIDGKLIAVDIRVKGGYVMCPPFTKGPNAVYTWKDAKLDYKVPIAPMPNWMLKNILTTIERHKGHFEAQQFTCEPDVNSDVTDEDIEFFKNTPSWKDFFTIDAKPNQHNIYYVTAHQQYHCDICDREHVNNVGRPRAFLVRTHNKLRFVCRPGNGFNRLIEPDYAKLWNVDGDWFLVHSIIVLGDIILRVSGSLFRIIHKDDGPFLQARLVIDLDLLQIHINSESSGAEGDALDEDQRQGVVNGLGQVLIGAAFAKLVANEDGVPTRGAGKGPLVICLFNDGFNGRFQGFFGEPLSPEESRVMIVNVLNNGALERCEGLGPSRMLIIEDGRNVCDCHVDGG